MDDGAKQKVPGIINRENWIGALPDSVRIAVEARMTSFAVEPGMPIKRAGEAATRIFQVESGFLSLIGLHADGRQALITIYAAGNCFSETAMISRRMHNHTTIALTPSVMRQLNREDFWELYHQHPEIPEALCRKFAEAISRQMASREQRATQRLGKRVAMMFANLAEHAGSGTSEGGVRIALPITQSDIADLFDVTRQSVHREVTYLKQLKLVDRHRKDWIILDPSRLRQMCTY